MSPSVKAQNVFKTRNLIQIFWKTKTLFKKLEYRFLIETTKIENTLFPFKSALSECNVKGTPNYKHVLVLFTSKPCRYVNWIEVICYLHLCMSINYNLFLTSCVFHPAHITCFANYDFMNTWLFSHRDSHFFKTSH